jgi:SAM-dependent methyltransferase
LVEQIKAPIRALLYPFHLVLANVFARKRFQTQVFCAIDQWYWGHRGSEYHFMRRQLNRLHPIRGTRILVIGCGTGRDLASWIAYRPKELLAVDYFRYDRAWTELTARYGNLLRFSQADATNLNFSRACSFDIVGSDAVLEHLTNVPAAAAEAYRVLKPGGTFYAAFGPLWHCWGGDHFSGWDAASNGYNHIVLDEAQYKRYQSLAGEYVHSEHDGRTWIRSGLFSYLRVNEYLQLIQDAGFLLRHIGIVIEPRASKCLKHNPSLRNSLRSIATDVDLAAAGMILFAERPLHQGLERGA